MHIVDQPSKVKDRIKLCSLQKVRNNEAHGESREPERILLSYAAASSAISFQALYTALPEDEMPWFAYQQFCNLVGNMTDLVVKEQNMQPTIDAIWENRTIEDYEAKNSTVRNDFLRHWNHGPSGKTVSYEGMVEEGGDIMDVADPRADFENKVLSEGKVKAFKSRLTEKDSEILRLRMEGHTEQEIADAVGIKTASAVHKRIAKLAEAYDDFVTKEYQNRLG